MLFLSPAALLALTVVGDLVPNTFSIVSHLNASLSKRDHWAPALVRDWFNLGPQPLPGYYTRPFYPLPEAGALKDVWTKAFSKARKLVEKMLTVEKVNLTTGSGWGSGPCIGNTGLVPRLGIPSLCLQDGPNGVRFTDFVTAFPSGLAAGATFNRGLMYLRGKAMGKEMRKKGVHVMLGPVVGPLGLKAQGGRNWELFGADPYLQGVAVLNTVDGVQEEGVLCAVKHFVGNEQERYRQPGEWGDRDSDNESGFSEDEDGMGDEYPDLFDESYSANIGDRAMHEVYMWPFADAVHAGVGAVMCAYNQVNNTYACENLRLINYLLKHELGFQGFVVLDWGAQHLGVYSALAGLDMTMPGEVFDDWCLGKLYWGALLTRAVYNKTLPQQRLDDMAMRILAPFFSLDGEQGDLPTEEDVPNFSSWTHHTYGQAFPYQHYGPIEQVNWHRDVRSKLSDDTALQVAREAVVLLKNDGRHLPIHTDDGVRRMLVVGAALNLGSKGATCKDQKCVDGTLTSGWGSAAVNNPWVLTPYEEIAVRSRQQGMVVDFTLELYDLDTVDELADYADMAVVVVLAYSGEGFLEVDGNFGDRKNLSLWHNGDEVVEHVADRCRKTVVVVNSVGPVDMERWVEHENVVAVVYTPPLGQYVGQAIAEVLFGEVNPSGHLPFTIARKVEHYVPVLTHASTKVAPQDDYDRDLYVDYRFFDKHNIRPRFEFGFGLLYTQFKLCSLQIKELSCPTEYLPCPGSYCPMTPFPEDDICDPEDALFPHEDMTPVPGFIYPYLFNDRIRTVADEDEFEYPKGYDPDVCDEEPPLAGGGLGGNPALWDVLYQVQAEVKNDGSSKGLVAVQLYVEFPHTQFALPLKQLRGFDKVCVDVGHSAEVHFELTHRDLSVWDPALQQWIIQTGVYKVYLGTSSRRFQLCGEIEIE